MTESKHTDRCPACGAGRLDTFYDVENIPVHSCIMLSTREEARAFPRADLRLAVCPRCGFACNVLFDPQHSAYSSLYEDQQTFSSTFNAFAKKLAADLVDRHDLRGKHVVEIGCGKADFLALVCELGQNTGVGIDPACIPERLDPALSDRITLITDYYSERYADRVGEMIMCRHTMEHVPDVRRFTDTVRRSLQDLPETSVFIEVPDAGRVIRDLAFEDIYYEHCSYFGPGSLARMFRGASFEVTNVALDYDDQYLLLEAVPSAGPTEGGFELEESPDDMVGAAQAFAERIPATLDRWRDDVVRMHDEGRRPVIWGSGSKCVAFLTTLGLDEEIEAVVDINPHRHGRFIPGVGKEVVAPARLREIDPGTVIVMNRVYRDEIAGTLERMGLRPEIVAL